jgi:NSS family neurotransmitter:Na+ symporter
MIRGDFVGQTPPQVSGQFGQMVGNAPLLVGVMALVTVLGFFICSLGLKKGVEKINKVMMLLLLAIIIFLAIYVCTLPGAGEGLKYYLVPDFTKIFNANFGEVMFAALGQAFFTLSIGMGSMAIFGSYIKKDRRLLGESITIAGLDTAVAFIAGLIIIPSMFAFGLQNAEEQAGPGLIFQTLPNVFNQMPGGSRIWGTIFFVFMIFAAMSTVTAVFENIISFGMDKWGWSRRKSCLINLGLMIVLALPCVFGFNILSGIMPFGIDPVTGSASTIMDLEDFIISNNILPLGSLVYVLFCTWDKKGWGFDNFLKEANQGKGVKLSSKLKVYLKYILPVMLLAFWVWGIVSFFA